MVTFDQQPGDARCPSCGLRMYLTDRGAVGRYLPEGWQPGGFQGRRAAGDDGARPPEGGG